MLDNMESEHKFNPENEKKLPFVELRGGFVEGPISVEQLAIITEDGEQIGSLDLVHDPFSSVVEIGSIKIEDQHRGQGFGLATYIKLIERCKSHRRKLESTFAIGSGAVSVWEKLVKMGLAEEHKQGNQRVFISK